MKHLWLVLVALLAFNLTANDDETDDLLSLSLEDLLQMEVVSATRSKSKLSESPIPISVITAQDIQSSGLDNLPDILARLPEVDVLHVGRSQTEVSMRGKGIIFNRRTLVLIDGRPEYNDLFGVTFWNAFPINIHDVERIEVVRGPASALFGANAFTGVINIITKSVDDSSSSDVRFHAGTRGNQQSELTWRHKASEKTAFKLWGGNAVADSYQTDVPFEGFQRFTTTNNITDDPESLDMVRFGGQMIWTPDESWDVRLNLGASDGELELFQQPGLPRSRWDITNTNVYVNATKVLSDTGSLQFSGYLSRFEYQTPLAPSRTAISDLSFSDGRFYFPSIEPDSNGEAFEFKGESETLNLSSQYVGSYYEGALNVVFGMEWRFIEHTSGTRDGRRLGLVRDIQKNNEGDFTPSVFTNFTYKFGNDQWILGLGGRYDTWEIDIDDLPGFQTYQDEDYGYVASLSYFPADGHAIRATSRRAFRAPSLFEMGSDISLRVPGQNHGVNLLGVGTLNTEAIESFDITYTGRLTSKLQVSAEYFTETYDELIGNPDSGILDLIDFDDISGQFTTTTTFSNLVGADNQGYQLGLTWLPSQHLSVMANTAVLDPDGLNDLSGETFFSPETKFNLGVQYRAESGLQFDLDAHYVDVTDPSEFTSEAPNDPHFTLQHQQDYTYVNCKVAWLLPNVGKGFEAYVAGYNVLDDDRVEYYEYDAVLKGVGEAFGREVIGGISWKF